MNEYVYNLEHLLEREHQTNLNLLRLIEIYEERIDKAIEYIEKCLKQTPIENRTKNDDTLDIEYEYILGILKEVE
ncbi:MAG: hypothetical protein SOZ53_02225 [Candidatus Onthovivens sp.]|nr:hypothetical protein [Candidatus Onthovivens sp.]